MRDFHWAFSRNDTFPFGQTGNGLFPVSVEVSAHEADTAEHPVQKHGIPHTQSAHTTADAKNIAEANPEYYHGKNGDTHWVLHIIAGSEHIGEYKTHRPQDDGTAIVDHHQLVGKLGRLAAEAVQGQQKPQIEEMRITMPFLYKELEQAEGCVDAQQRDTLPALQLLPGQSGDAQQQHDNQHQGNVQH